MQFFLQNADRNESVGFQSRPSDESSVDILLRKQFGCICRFHRTAVLNDRFVGDFFVVELFDMSSAKRVNRLRVFWRRGFSRTDRPHRLVCDRNARHFGGRYA